MIQSQKTSKRMLDRQVGFSLVEIMVGLVIGLLATLVIMQVFSVFEGQKRSTTGTADAQTNGSVALFNVKRDVQLAAYGLFGFGLTNLSPLRCDPQPMLAATVAGVATTIGVTPITIIDGGAAGSDQIIVRYADTQTSGMPNRVIGAAGAVNTNLACSVGDDVVVMTSGGSGAAGAAACSATTVTALPDATHVTLAAAPAVGSYIICLGNWNQFTYRVNGNNLERVGQAAVADVVASDVVDIQAQYGVVAAGAAASAVTTDDNLITEWVDAAGADWAAPSVNNRNRIKAVRIAVVARNGLLEKENVTNVCSSTTAANPTGLCAWDATSAAPVTASPAPAINLAADANWQRYRYRVYETIIPLRNVIWSWGSFQ